MDNPPSLNSRFTQLGQEKAIWDGIYNSDDEAFREKRSKHIYDLLTKKKIKEVLSKKDETTSSNPPVPKASKKRRKKYRNCLTLFAYGSILQTH